QPAVLADLPVLPRGHLADEIRRPDQQHREQDKVVEDLVPDRFAEDVHGHDRRRPHGCSLWGCFTSSLLTCWTKKSSSVSRSGLSDTSRAPLAPSAATSRSGGGSSGTSSA